MTVFWFLLYAQKERLRGEPYSLCLCKRLRDAEGEKKLLSFTVNPSVSLAADSLSLRLGHGAALICHRHIIHYRAATSLPLIQGSLWGGVTAGWLLEYHITVITLSKNGILKKDFFCVTNN